MAAKGDERVNAVTFFASQVDFEKAGDLLVYVDDEQVKWMEERMSQKGYLPGSRMADAFNLLRSNDLIWSYVVNNYMLAGTRCRSTFSTGMAMRRACRRASTALICANAISTIACQRARWCSMG